MVKISLVASTYTWGVKIIAVNNYSIIRYTAAATPSDFMLMAFVDGGCVLKTYITAIV